MVLPLKISFHPVVIRGLLTVAVLLCRGSAFCEQALSPCNRVADEMAFRKQFISSAIDPVYPESSIRAKHTGLAVARICIGAGSTRVTSIEVVTAPDAAIATAMRKAIEQWRFVPAIDHQNGRETPYDHATKITYYFAEQRGRWVILNPADLFYVGPQFARAQYTGLSPHSHQGRS